MKRPDFLHDQGHGCRHQAGQLELQLAGHCVARLQGGALQSDHLETTVPRTREKAYSGNKERMSLRTMQSVQDCAVRSLPTATTVDQAIQGCFQPPKLRQLCLDLIAMMPGNPVDVAAG